MKLLKLYILLVLAVLAVPAAEAQITAKVVRGISFSGPTQMNGGPTMSGYEFEIHVYASKPILVSSVVAGWERTKYYTLMSGQTSSWTRIEKIPVSFTFNGGPYINFTPSNPLRYVVRDSGYPVDQLNRLIFRAQLQGDYSPTQVQVGW